MTRKDYRLIAAVLIEARHRVPGDWNIHDYLARMMAFHLSEQSARFDYGRFLSACEYGQNRIPPTPLGF